MNNKNQAIEEMAKIMCNNCIENELMTCSFTQKGMPCLFSERFAEELYNAGYTQKIGNDEVVISKEEYENLQVAKDFDYGYHEGEQNMTAYYENIKLPETRKETAREILQELSEHTQRVKNLPNKVFSWKEKFERLEELIAEIYPRNYGVEVE